MDIPISNHHINSTERVFVAHVNDLNDFYLHSDLVRESLLKLGQDLYNEYSDSLTNPSKTRQTLNVGDYCACPSESQDWYRGIIRQLDSNGLATVFKVDYGDVLFIEIQFLQPLQQRFFNLNRLAFHCSLANLIKPVDGWPLEIVNEFQSRLTTTFLFAKFINYNEARDLLQVEITEKSSKSTLNKEFELYQIERSELEINDKNIYRHVPMGILDLNQMNQICMLYYISPRRFYVYLRDKLNLHNSFQSDLQIVIQNFLPIPSPVKYQPVAVQDNHAIWHRAVVLELISDLSKVCVYFIDIGQKEYVSLNNIRQLPHDFQINPAFAIPCCLHNVGPMIVRNEPSIWRSDDQVHDELNRLMVNSVTCQVYAKQDQICYNIEIDIPKVGDLGTFLSDKNFISRTTMQNSQRSGFSSGQSAQSFVRPQGSSTGIPPSRQQYPRPTQSNEYFTNLNNMHQQQTRMLNTGPQNVPVQQSPGAMGMSAIPTLPPQNGVYTIMQVHSAAEFYGLSQSREQELEQFSNYLENYYNNSINDPSLNITLFMEGTPCVIQQNDKYHRVTIKHREGETRVIVKLVDRGDEIIVDTSELLQIENNLLKIPAFAQPFRLNGYDESQSSANITRCLKKSILNQRVHISPQGSIIHGFYPVEVTLSNNQSVSQMLANEKNLPVTSPISNNRPSFNAPTRTIESQVFNNSNKVMSHKTNDVLAPPPKILTGATRTQPGRFGAANQTGSLTSSTNEQMSRFSSSNNRNPQQPQQQQQQQQQQSQMTASTSSSSGWNKDQNNRSGFSSGGITNQPPFGRQHSGSGQFGNNQRSDEFKVTISNNQTRPQSYDYQSSLEEKRTFSSGFTGDNRNERQMGGNNFSQNNDRGNDSEFRRGGGFGSRGGGFAGRGSRGGGSGDFHNRNNDDNNNENNSQSSGGFARRGGGGGGGGGGGNFADRGNRGRNFQDRNGANRYEGDNNNMRGGFQNRRGQGDGGEFRGRGGGRGSRGGSGFSSRGGGANFRDMGDNIELSSNTDNSIKSSASWSTNRAPPVNFEAGDRFIENDIPKDTFKFVISQIESANDFFIQLMSKADTLGQLTDVLQEEYTKAPAGNLSSFKQNQPCLAKHIDGCWYRAIVLSHGLATLQIRFIDFGDTITVNEKTIRQLAKKHCSAPPYAYRCTFKNAEAVKNVNKEDIEKQCEGKEFNGKILVKASDGKFTLESDDFIKVLININAIKLKSEGTLKRIKCTIVHIEHEQERFYIQDNEDIIDKISELITTENEKNATLSADEVKQLEPNTMVIAAFEDEPYRAIIQSHESDDNIKVCYIDFGNTGTCLNTSLKRCSEQLSSYPPQAKCCQLCGISSNEITNAFKYLEEKSDSENAEVTIIKEDNGLFNVLVFIDDECINEKYGYNPNSTENNDSSTETDDQSSTTTTTTVKEQEQSTPVIEKQISSDISKHEIEDLDENQSDSSKSREGLLTHFEKEKALCLSSINSSI